MDTSNRKQFLELMEHNKNRILKICWLYTKNTHDQEDLFQEVVLNLWKSYPQLRESKYASTWLYRISLNVCMKYSLSTKKENKLKLSIFHFYKTIENHHQKDYDDLYRCINLLENAEKSIILLYLEDLPYKEIAEIIGISENYVAVKVKRIREKLFQCLNKEDYER